MKIDVPYHVFNFSKGQLCLTSWEEGGGLKLDQKIRLGLMFKDHNLVTIDMPILFSICLNFDHIEGVERGRGGGLDGIKKLSQYLNTMFSDY